MRTAEKVWPVAVDGVRGWPYPDGAYDDQCGMGRPDWRGFRPWAVWQSEPHWYVAFYTCDRGHAWTCGYGMVLGAKDLSQLRDIPISPTRCLPSDDYLRAHGIIPLDEIVLRLVSWSDE